MQASSTYRPPWPWVSPWSLCLKGTPIIRAAATERCSARQTVEGQKTALGVMQLFHIYGHNSLKQQRLARHPKGKGGGQCGIIKWSYATKKSVSVRGNTSWTRSFSPVFIHCDKMPGLPLFHLYLAEVSSGTLQSTSSSSLLCSGQSGPLAFHRFWKIQKIKKLRLLF